MERPRLSDRQRVAACRALEEIEQQLTLAADFLDDFGETRAASMLLAASRSVLACAYLVQPASIAQVMDVSEQLPPRR